MYDPKFEKAIQQKMEELEFRPPESVWVNIEKAVVVKRRRRSAFLWRYLLPAVFVAAAAGLYWRHVDTPAKPADGKTTHPIAGSGVASGPAADNSAAGSSVVSRPTGGADAAARSMAQAGRTAGGGPTDLSVARAGSSRSAGRMSIAEHDRRDRHVRAGETSLGDQTAALGEAATTGRSEPDGRVELAGRSEPAGQAEPAGRPQAAGPKKPAAWFFLPGLADQRLTPQVQASALNTKKSNSAAMAGLLHPLRRWEAGFVAGGGLSRLNRLNSEQARSALAPSTTSFYTISNATSPSNHYISNVQPEASFEGGIYLQRPLSDRWIFNTGMNLHYYSNRISVGQQVTTYVQSSVSYLLATTVQTAATAAMYSAGDTRSVINKYYFLELPVGLQWKVNKSRLLPIFVEGNVSLSRLMGASALFYNAKTGLYSKEGDVVNKTQVTVGSALLVGLPFHGVNIQVGPQIQYGLTPLVNTQGVGDQHLLYTGIRLVIIPGRK
ncbi:MAG TPA: hypothetical protein VGS79_23010 [Puia sp.]|nr:hypothetical protein [Puia sp.]